MKSKQESWRSHHPSRLHGGAREQRMLSRTKERVKKQLKDVLGPEGIQSMNDVGRPIHANLKKVLYGDPLCVSEHKPWWEHVVQRLGLKKDPHSFLLSHSSGSSSYHVPRAQRQASPKEQSRDAVQAAP